MISALQPLADLPGVRIVMMVTQDGVPIAVPGRPQPGAEDEPLETGPLGKDDELAAFAIGWVNELQNEIAGMSWDPPDRICMQAARGTLVIQRARGSYLLLILSRGMDPEDVRLPMDGTIARIERGLKNMGGESGFPDLPPPFPASSPQGRLAVEPPGALPSQHPSNPIEDPAEVKHFESQEPSGT